MKVVFVGPSLPDACTLVSADVLVKPPAVQRDILQAVHNGATVIGLIDGGFEYTAPVSHKEILYALSLGVTVFGASSMGALRAAECETFGMIGVGKIFCGYISGELVDDADVALLHSPAELGSVSLTLPLVNVHATLDAVTRTGEIDPFQAQGLAGAAAELSFKERTWRSIVASCEVVGNGADLEQLLAAAYVDQKRLDALELIWLLQQAPDQRLPSPRDWVFQETTIWQEMRRLS
jgi:hypothetical protein